MYHLMVVVARLRCFVFGFWVFRFFGFMGYGGLLLMARRILEQQD